MANLWQHHRLSFHICLRLLFVKCGPNDPENSAQHELRRSHEHKIKGIPELELEPEIESSST
jgi:hypothetical protein